MTFSARVTVFLMMAVAGLASATGAGAQSCNATVNVDFGLVNLVSGNIIDQNGTASISCSGFAANATIRVCAGISDGPAMDRLLEAGNISYRLYSNSGRTAVWGTTSGAPNYPAGEVVQVNSGGSLNFNLNVYGRIFAGQNATPTTALNNVYQSVPLVAVGAADATINPDCATVGNQGGGGGTALIRATYEPVCSITANAMAFGSVASTLQNVDRSTSISATCSAATLFTLALDGGQGGSLTSPTNREMRHNGNTLWYGLYSDGAYTLAWGATAGLDLVSGSGTGSSVAIPVYGRIQPQTTPPAGLYTDVVIVTITY